VKLINVVPESAKVIMPIDSATPDCLESDRLYIAE